nr:hypothetical protein [Sinomicrobium sp.]
MANTMQILRLICSHDYFSGDIEGLTLRPTADTKRWADRHGVLMRILPMDITLFGTAQTPEDYEGLLTFFIQVDDTQFYNYTVLPPVSTKDKLCYLTNKDGNSNATTTVDASCFLDKKYAIAVHKDSIGEEKPLRIENQSGDIMAELPWNGQQSLFSCINDLPPGKYNWTYGDNDKGFFFGAPELTAKVFGLVEIDLNAAEKAEFRIHFNARASIWEYYIIDKKVNGNGYEIVDEKQQYRFGAAEQTAVLGGKPAVKIMSETPIPFKQYPDYEFKLVTKVNSGGMKQPWNATMALPTGRSEHLQLSEAEQLAYITPIYIYI